MPLLGIGTLTRDYRASDLLGTGMGVKAKIRKFHVLEPAHRDGAESIWARCDPSRYWAFASITNNETQHITVESAQ